MKKNPPVVAVDFLLNYGYGLQLTRGVGRYFSLHSELLFRRTVIKDITKMDKGTVRAALGHFHEKAHWDVMRKCGVSYVISVSNRSGYAPWAKWIPDDREVGRMAARYFLRKHHRNFAVVTADDFAYGRQRLEGFLEVLADQGIHEVPRASAPIWNLLDLGEPALPLALFVMSDMQAVNVMSHLLQKGYRIPEDVAVLGVDNDEVVLPYCPVPLSSVQLPLEKMGFEVCRELQGMMARGEPHQGIRKFPPLGVVERRSTEQMAVYDPLVRKVQAYVEENLGNIEDVGEIAGAMFMHRRSLDRHFLEAAGMTPSEWLMRRRVAYAEKLFIETDYTVAYVAELSGLCTPMRLYRSFKKLARPLPSVLRKERAVRG